MVLPPLTETGVVLNAEAADWRSAVRLAGGALTAMGSARPGYADEMIRMIDEHGPYVVIAPGLALAHARPGADVSHEGLSVITLADPVAFGHPHNDPVSVVLGLAVTTPESHVTSVADLANVFNDAAAIPAVAAATTPDEVRRVLSATE